MPAPVHPSVWCLRLQSRARMTAGDSSVIAIVRLTVFCSAAPGSPHEIIAGDFVAHAVAPLTPTGDDDVRDPTPSTNGSAASTRCSQTSTSRSTSARSPTPTTSPSARRPAGAALADSPAPRGEAREVGSDHTVCAGRGRNGWQPVLPGPMRPWIRIIGGPSPISTRLMLRPSTTARRAREGRPPVACLSRRHAGFRACRCDRVKGRRFLVPSPRLACIGLPFIVRRGSLLPG